eukprot:757179-Hanusia_phi.AAC.1
MEGGRITSRGRESLVPGGGSEADSEAESGSLSDCKLRASLRARASTMLREERASSSKHRLLDAKIDSGYYRMVRSDLSLRRYVTRGAARSLTPRATPPPASPQTLVNENGGRGR